MRGEISRVGSWWEEGGEYGFYSLTLRPFPEVVSSQANRGIQFDVDCFEVDIITPARHNQNLNRKVRRGLPPRSPRTSMLFSACFAYCLASFAVKALSLPDQFVLSGKEIVPLAPTRVISRVISIFHKKLSERFAPDCIQVTRIRVQSRRSGDSLAQLCEVYLQNPARRLQRRAMFGRRTLPNE
jgi:hypothetical protein